ncbi:alcohol dehydrogenase catalytic domain-containing protein [Halalkalicoccus jeotgali]|uniref:Alcohol dehydrogenase GroES domain protein n=1 Tax=Halalkalicoccus jeotgali (strain DSM 18796 / CECT 7217 / JCM 14584 / KCTC 4019 / B3) TaxID=795797 RepID=D8JCX4_HALJB|nr:zinc-binding dehydrogenase [Halalkalicoccus jeotgali]ADJ16869.1 Alcohol dehydrogenase GroES domain protein [Halalkalicoccus jeotgali B3]
MRAVRYHEAGAPSVLELEAVDRPTPKGDELLVAVRAASINPTDAKRRQWGPKHLPKTTGSDFAGVVESVGDHVTAFESGDRVCGTGLHTDRFQQGSFQEYVTVPTDIVAMLPDSVSFKRGAAAALAGVTAWRALVDHAGLEPAETCFVHGGTGGVGHLAVQLSAALSTDTITTVGTEEAERAATEFGADTVLRYDDPELQESVDQPVDVIVDHRIDEYLGFDIGISAFGGRIVQYAGEDGDFEGAREGRSKNLSLHMMNMSNLASRSDTTNISEPLSSVLELVARGVINPQIHQNYSLDEAAEMHRAILEDSFIGKLVVTV